MSILTTYFASRFGLRVSWTTTTNANAFTSKVKDTVAQLADAMTVRNFAPAVA